MVAMVTDFFKKVCKNPGLTAKFARKLNAILQYHPKWYKTLKYDIILIKNHQVYYIKYLFLELATPF